MVGLVWGWVFLFVFALRFCAGLIAVILLADLPVLCVCY